MSLSPKQEESLLIAFIMALIIALCWWIVNYPGEIIHP